jgi:hypothetical protein
MKRQTGVSRPEDYKTLDPVAGLIGENWSLVSELRALKGDSL